MQLVQTLYRGMGPAIEPFLGELKPVQVKEINDAFENMDKEGIGKGSLKPERETREQQRKGPEESTDLNAVESSPGRALDYLLVNQVIDLNARAHSS
jgi:cytoskeleton-associated protein 5